MDPLRRELHQDYNQFYAAVFSLISPNHRGEAGTEGCSALTARYVLGTRPLSPLEFSATHQPSAFLSWISRTSPFFAIRRDRDKKDQIFQNGSTHN